MRKILYTTLISLVLIDVFLFTGYYQPFTAVEISGQVTKIMPANTVVINNEHVYPFSPSGIFVLDGVHMSCNRGQWIPVLFDCTIWVHHIKPTKVEA